MKRETNIVQRGNVLYLRIAIPADLRLKGGAAEVWRSLRTRDYSIARARCAEVRADLFRQWENERLIRRRDQDQRHFSQQEIDAIAAELYTFEMTLDEKETEHNDYRRNTDDVSISFRASHLQALQGGLTRGEFDLAKWWVDHVIERDGLGIKYDDADYRQLCFASQRVMIDAVKAKMGRDQGNYGYTPADPITKAPPRRSKERNGEGLMDLFARYRHVNPNGVKQASLDQDELVLGLLDSFLQSPPAADVTRTQIRDWRDALSRYPSRATQIAEFRGMTMRETIETNKSIGKPTLSRKTINRYLSAASSYFKWLLSEGYRETENPVAGLFYAKDKSAKVRSYTVKELEKLFTSTWFTGDAPRDHRFWLPLICLFSGARLGEAAQLLKADVRERHGHWIMHITTEGDSEKSVKTESSMRIVPLHPELIKLGFVDFAKNSKGSRVFSEVERDTAGKWGQAFSRDFGRYLKQIGIKDDQVEAASKKRITFHSFRHTFTDAMRRADYDEHDIGLLLGHAKKTTTGRYGNERAEQIARKAAMIEKVAYPGLDLSHLRPNAR